MCFGLLLKRRVETITVAFAFFYPVSGIGAKEELPFLCIMMIRGKNQFASPSCNGCIFQAFPGAEFKKKKDCCKKWKKEKRCKKCPGHG